MGKQQNSKEQHAVEAWEIARKIAAKADIPDRDAEDLRSDLYLKYAKTAEYFENARRFGGAVAHAMRNDVRDEGDRSRTGKARFFAAMDSLDAPKSDADDDPIEVVDPKATPESFLGELDRKYRKTRLNNWRRKFRRRVLRLDDGLREFLFKLDGCLTQNQLVAATGLCRKTCFNKRRQLQLIFADLLHEHRAIKALEIN